MTQTLHASPGAAVDPIFAPPMITGTSSKEALDILSTPSLTSPSAMNPS